MKTRIHNGNPLTLNVYQILASVHAVYPGKGKDDDIACYYLALGLCGEAGEYAKCVKKLMRGDYKREDSKTAPALAEAQRDLRILELGDVLWYLAMAAQVEGVTLEEVAMRNLTKLEKRMEEKRMEAGKVVDSGDTR